MECLDELSGTTSFPLNDPFWETRLLTEFPKLLADLSADSTDKAQVEDGLLRVSKAMMHNNPSTGNFATLVSLFVHRLQAAPPAAADSEDDKQRFWFETLALATLVRTFAGYLIANLSPAQLTSQLAAGQPPPEAKADTASDAADGAQAEPPTPLVALLMEAMVDMLTELPVVTATFALHVEGLSLLLVLCSSQMYYELGSGPHLFLDALQSHLTASGKGPVFVRTLLFHFIQKRTAPAPQSSWTQMLLGAASSVILFPVHAFNWVFSTDSAEFPLGEQSLLLLLVLSHYFPGAEAPSAGPNPVREALASISDSMHAAQTGPEMEEMLTYPGQAGPPGVPYGVLYSVLTETVGDLRCTLLFYVLIHYNPDFQAHVLNSASLGNLLIPMFRMLYDVDGQRHQQIYMLLIVILILAQDKGFCDRIHKIKLPSVPWYTERILSDISLGSLAVIILVRTDIYNLTQLKDVYLHTNCLAALANMASHFADLHPEAASRLLVLLQMLGKRFLRVRARRIKAEDAAAASAKAAALAKASAAARSAAAPPTETSEADDNIEVADIAGSKAVASPQSQTALPPPTLDGSQGDHGGGAAKAAEAADAASDEAMFGDFLRIVFEILNAALTIRLSANPNLVYALLHKRDLLADFRSHPSFSDLVENIQSILAYFSAQIDEARADYARRYSIEPGAVALEVEELVGIISAASMIYDGSHLKSFPPLEFKYSADEKEAPEEFFTPYIWSLVFDYVGLHWDADRIRIFAV